jgi:microcystin-dependent protein
VSEPYIDEIRMFAGIFAPRSWALCDGQLLMVTQYDALFSLLGTMYGGDGRTTFGLPDLRGRIPIHKGTAPGLSNRPQGQKSGQETVTLNANQILANHSHNLMAGSSPSGKDPAANDLSTPETAVYGPAADMVEMNAQAIGHAGDGQARSHNNIQPFMCIHFIIALVGIYPSQS